MKRWGSVKEGDAVKVNVYAIPQKEDGGMVWLLENLTVLCQLTEITWGAKTFK